MTTQNPWSDFLESDDTGRRAAYFSRSGQFGGRGKSQRQENFYENSFADIYNKYVGSLGLQVRQGQMPTGTWGDYTDNFDWDQNYRDTVPYEERNRGAGAFVPQMRWDVLRR